MRKLFLLIFIFTWCLPNVYAQYDSAFPEVLESSSFTFQYISKDSINKLEDGVIQKIGGDGIGERAGYEEVYLLQADDKIYVAIYDGEEWQISSDNFPDGWGISYSFSVVNLDGVGRYELLVTANDINSRGGRYYGYDNRANTFYLINVDEEYRVFLKENYYNEHHSYIGYRADYTDTSDEDREMEEMDNEDNWEYSEEVDDCEVRVTNGSLFFENISCTGCDDFSDSIFAIEYKLRNDTLVKDKVIPYYTNSSLPYSYKVLRGTLGKRTITMHLTKQGKYYTGYYFDGRRHEYIELSDNSHYKNAKAPIVLKEFQEDNYFFGEIVGSNFSGKWVSRKKEKEFQLEENYREGETRLTAYSFSDSVIGKENNRYAISTSYYLADTNAMSKSEAIKINDALLGRRGYEGDVLVSNPYSVFYSFRTNILDGPIDIVFDDNEDTKFYSSLDSRLYYNRSSLLSIMMHESVFTGGARVSHSFMNIVYDVKRDRTLGTKDILNCSDSVLRNLIEDVYLKKNGDSLQKHIDMLDRNFTGVILLKPDGLSFYFEQYPFTETILVPYARLKQYIRPEYLDRLL